eukprot:TRINITY_DN36634_c0_g1_i1.p1 TRINITY_DN36634_c0_g1~~TRINITY_DN36634_c0_g1_i1.p1  ORF type:complete len:287 (-),score=29.73 TRINITY_DN36634_c0_g1_i1:214-1029(-)
MTKLPREPAWLPTTLMENELPVLSLGGNRSGIPFHSHGATWLLCLTGHKRWFIVPRGRASKRMRGNQLYSSAEWVKMVLPNLNASLRPYTFVQKPGDVVFLPDGWAHLTVNLDKVLAVGMQSAIRRFKEPRATVLRKCLAMVSKRDPDACVVAARECREPHCKKADAANYLKKALEAAPFHLSVALNLASELGDLEPLRGIWTELVRKPDQLLNDPAVDKLAFGLLVQILTDEMLRVGQLMREDLERIQSYINSFTKDESGFIRDFLDPSK